MIAIQNGLGSKGGVALWSARKSYKVGDLVTLNGVLYIAKQASKNQSPSTDSAYWNVEIDTNNKDLVIKAVEQDLDASGFSPVANTLYQHTGASATNYKINGLYYYTGTAYIDAFSINTGGMFISYVTDTTTALPTTRTDGSALKNEDYVKPASNATLPLTIGGLTFNNVNDTAHWNGTAWYLIGYSFKTANIGVTTPATESLSGDKTTQAEINAEFVTAIKENTARYITADASGNAFATKAALTSASKYYYAGAEVTPDKNDYAVVLADEEHNNSQTRYVFQEGTPGVWAFQYVLNFAIADDTLVATSTGIKVQRKENGGIEVDSTTGSKGIYVKLAEGGGLDNVNGGLVVKVNADSGLTATSDGLAISNSVTAETTGKGSSTKTITIKYDKHGNITSVTENDIPTANTSTAGLAQLSSTISSSDETKAVNGKAVADYVAAALKHTFNSFSIATSDWTEEAQSTLGTSYKATVTATGATTNDMLQVYFALASLNEASECGIVADITAANTITFYAVDAPTAAITGKYEVLVAASN